MAKSFDSSPNLVVDFLVGVPKGEFIVVYDLSDRHLQSDERPL